MLNRKEVFERVKNHLTAQGCKAFDTDKGCLYRGPHGTKCAIGALIADEFYLPDFEGKRVEEEMIARALEASLGVTLEGEDMNFLIDLQSIHDDSNVYSWKEQFRAVAARWDL